MLLLPLVLSSLAAVVAAAGPAPGFLVPWTSLSRTALPRTALPPPPPPPTLTATALPNGLALTPPRGFSTWDQHPDDLSPASGHSVTESECMNYLDGIVANGLNTLNYTYFIVDEPCFVGRDASGTLLENKTTWPHGLAWFREQLRKHDMKVRSSKGDDIYIGTRHTEESSSEWNTKVVHVYPFSHCHIVSRCTTVPHVPLPSIPTAFFLFLSLSPQIKLGIYTCVGPKTCGGCVASEGHEDQDVQTFADWGAEYLKVDSCSRNCTASAGITNTSTCGKNLWSRFSSAIEKTGKDMIYSIVCNCDPARGEQPWKWGAEYANSWRTNIDFQNGFQAVPYVVDCQRRMAGNGSWCSANGSYWVDGKAYQV